jgi:hypothetical protein
MKMVYNAELKKMVPMAEVTKEKQEAGYERFSISADLCDTLKNFAKMDGWDFSGTSQVTLKDSEGKTRKDKDGNTLYKKDKDGNIETIKVAESKAKVTNAIKTYIEIAIRDFIAAREAAANKPAA